MKRRTIAPLLLLASVAVAHAECAKDQSCALKRSDVACTTQQMLSVVAAMAGDRSVSNDGLSAFMDANECALLPKGQIVRVIGRGEVPEVQVKVPGKAEKLWIFKLAID